MGDIDPSQTAFSRGSALHPAGTMAGGTKGFLHGFLSADGDVGVAPHVSGNKNRLTYMLVDVWNIRVLSRECPGGSLAMNAKSLSLSVNSMFLYLSDIVSHVVNLLHP